MFNSWYINLYTLLFYIINLNLISVITPEYRIEFDKKIKLFRNQYKMNMYNADLEIFINRKNLFYDTYDQIMNKTPFELKKKLHIKYKLII